MGLINRRDFLAYIAIAAGGAGYGVLFIRYHG
ncbi:MAG: twin-arginine translocation signal domain-containing protein [Planctomycetes bacterium]|nr:twin-arginine translocation signal domain-containing protein [Planctomycetota bacterium]